MADVLKQIVEKVKESNNILVTVNSNPSVDELSAALGITLLINKLNKHATAVFSGAVPPAIKFLQPEKTFENTVDSLRDFIIALDKEKADHLRYKIVDDMVKMVSRMKPIWTMHWRATGGFCTMRLWQVLHLASRLNWVV